MAIGEAGNIVTNSPTENAPIRVDYAQPIENAVIALTGTNIGGNQHVLRVISQDNDGFTFIIEEWEYLDGPHSAVETINWIAIEEGVHSLPDGRIIEAGTTTADHTTTAVSLTGGFTNAPVVLTSVMSENETTTVDSDPLNITSGGFDLRLQEEEAEDGVHAGETVGYIAIQGGGDTVSGTAGVFGNLDEGVDTYGLGGTFTNAIVVAETQTINGGDTANVVISSQTGSTVDLTLQEETSADAETNHVNEDVGIVTFETGLIPCFCPGTYITTARGDVAVETLRMGDQIVTHDNGLQPLRWVSETVLPVHRLRTEPALRPVRICAHSFGPGQPAHDLLVSPQHRILFRGWQSEVLFGEPEVIVPARALINGHSVQTVLPQEDTPYFHLLLDRHEVVFSNGLASESLHAGTLSKAALAPETREELFTLFPDLRCDDSGYGKTVRRATKVQEGRLLTL